MKVSVYTRELERLYPFGLAKAVHFAAEMNGEKTPLNRNYGILFAKGKIAEDNTIIPLGIENPRIWRFPDGSFGISGHRVRESGEAFEEDEGRPWGWKTGDLIHFETMGILPETEMETASAKIEIEEGIVRRAIAFWNPEIPTKDPAVTEYTFPLSKGYGDPVIFPWEGKWYFISTNDNTNDVGIYVREADTVPGLFEAETKQHLILPYDPDRELIQTFWAPEFHLIGGELFILFAVSGKKWGPQCHLMKLKKGGSIIDPDSWSDPVRIVKKDGTPLATDAITLDMTYLKTETASYVVWSEREHIGDPLDSGSMLYIATIDEKEPWILTSEPVLLTRPLYGWENVEGTINNEGPNAFIRNGKVYLTYSGGAANGYTYAVGLLTADVHADLLDLSSWEKSISPIMSFYAVDEFGPGHNSFYYDENGNLMIAYHAEGTPDDHLRCDMIRKVCFKEDGTPFFV